MAEYSGSLSGITQNALTLCCSSGLTPHDRSYLDVCEDGSVSVYVVTLYGGDGTPMKVWHNCTLRYCIVDNADLDELHKALADGGRAAVLIDVIRDGHTVDWDGSNMVGRLTEAASEASLQLTYLLENLPQSNLSAWDAEEWLTAGGNTPALEVLRDADLPQDAEEGHFADAAARAVQIARGDRVILRGDVVDAYRKIMGEAYRTGET